MSFLVCSPGIRTRSFLCSWRWRSKGPAVGVPSWPCLSVRLRCLESLAVGIRARTLLGGGLAPERVQAAPERMEIAGRYGGQCRCGEGQGDERAAHSAVSRATPAAGLPGPRGPRWHILGAAGRLVGENSLSHGSGGADETQESSGASGKGAFG
jgi:hypothetical protein